MVDFSWPWRAKSKESEGHKIKTISIFMSFFFVINYTLGTGFLGIPYSFFYSGYVTAVPTLLLIMLTTLINGNYILEAMARAQVSLHNYLDVARCLHKPIAACMSYYTSYCIVQALEYLDHDELNLEDSFIGSSSSEAEISHPKFEVTIKRKFEISELSEVFVSKYLKYLFLACLTVYNMMVCWSYGSVAASAWATNIPFRMGGAEQCSNEAFFHRVLPTGGCLYSYYFFLTVFGVIVITISLLDLKEQTIVQFSMGALRFVGMGVMIAYCVAKLFEGGDSCLDIMESISFNTTLDGSIRPPGNLTNPVSAIDIVFKSNLKGWIFAIPVQMYGYAVLSGIPAFTHPVKAKKHLQALLVAVFVATTVCYLSLGVVIPLWFKVSIQETVTLNWVIIAA